MRVIGDDKSLAKNGDTVFDTISDYCNLYIKVKRSIYICLFTISHWSLNRCQMRFLLFPERESGLFDVINRSKAYHLQLWHSTNASLVICYRLCCLLLLARRAKLSIHGIESQSMHIPFVSNHPSSLHMLEATSLPFIFNEPRQRLAMWLLRNKERMILPFWMMICYRP